MLVVEARNTYDDGPMVTTKPKIKQDEKSAESEEKWPLGPVERDIQTSFG
jgi:hypothetical protein